MKRKRCLPVRAGDVFKKQKQKEIRVKPQSLGKWFQKAEKNKVVKSNLLLNTTQRNNDTGKKREKDNAKQMGKQLFLDYGQKDFEAKCCPRCGMSYTPGLKVDEDSHARFCDSNQEKIRLNANIKKLVCYTSDVSILLFQPRHFETKCLKNVIRKILDFKRCKVDVEMGFVSAKKWPERCFLAVKLDNFGHIVGVLVVERLESSRDILDALQEVDGVITTKKSNPLTRARPILGVLQVWVSSLHHRRGIASSLLDVVRENAVYGFVTPRDRVAFSQPTVSGYKFACSYTNQESIHVYSL